MSMLRLFPIAAAALLGGCATAYTYHSGNGDYYSGDPHVEYRYVSPGYIGYGYSPYPYGYWGGYRGYYGGYYGGYHPYYGTWCGSSYWYDPWCSHQYRGPYKPRHPGHRPPPPPGTPPPVIVPGGDGNGGTAHVPSGVPNDDNGLERPGRRYGNPPPIERPVVRRMRTPTGLPPSQVRQPMQVRQPTQGHPTTPTVGTPTPVIVQRPTPPAYRPPATVSVPRTTSTPSRTERAVDRARTRSGAADTP